MKSKKNKLLVINFGGLGDQILFLPALKTIKKAYADSHITFVTEPRSKSFDKLTDLIDETVICDIKGKNKYKNIISFLLKTVTQKFDTVISSGSSPQVSVLLFLTGIKRRIGYACGILSRILLTDSVSLNKNQYAANMYHDLVKYLDNDKYCNCLPEINISEEIIKKQKQIIGKTDKKIIIIHPGVSKLSIQKNILKFWKTSDWAELIKKLINTGNYKVILTGGPDDKDISSALQKEFADVENDIIDLTNKTPDITDLAAIIKLTDMIVCVDSAPMHLGIAVKTPTIALFGPTDERKLFPIKSDDYVAITADNLQCRPCLWDKRQTSCENPVCLDIPVKKVFDAIEKVFRYL